MINKQELSSLGDDEQSSSVNHDQTSVSHEKSKQNTWIEDIEYHSDKKNASLRLMIPTYLDNQLTQIAAAKRITKRFLILKALAQAGYHIEKEDLVTDKRRAK